MTTIFNDDKILTVLDLLPFVDTMEGFDLQSDCSTTERASWIRERLQRFSYRKIKRKEKGILQQYLCRVTGQSRRMIQYHIESYLQGKEICVTYERHQFVVTYSNRDRELLAEMDNLHGRLNGAATKKIMEQEYQRGDHRYESLRRISVSHLYNLRGSRVYRENALTFEKTNPVQVPIGERRKPEPNNIPGFLRVDTVHQGDKDRKKGVYHVNMVDEVTQWEVMLATEQISESCMEVVLTEALPLFPFVPQNYHSDNGGENINYTVAALLSKLDMTQTKGRPRHSNDNGLVETKNGAIIRKHMTYHHIPQPFASRINVFYRDHLIPYINFHRPCAFPQIEVLKNGKKKITYPFENYKTPYEKLKSLPHWEQYLRPGITKEMLDAQANAKTPNQAAREMQKAKEELLKVIIELPSGIL
jgi:hypothetical protein